MPCMWSRRVPARPRPSPSPCLPLEKRKRERAINSRLGNGLEKKTARGWLGLFRCTQHDDDLALSSLSPLSPLSLLSLPLSCCSLRGESPTNRSKGGIFLDGRKKRREEGWGGVWPPWNCGHFPAMVQMYHGSESSLCFLVGKHIFCGGKNHATLWEIEVIRNKVRFL